MGIRLGNSYVTGNSEEDMLSKEGGGALPCWACLLHCFPRGGCGGGEKVADNKEEQEREQVEEEKQEEEEHGEKEGRRASRTLKWEGNKCEWMIKDATRKTTRDVRAL